MGTILEVLELLIHADLGLQVILMGHRIWDLTNLKLIIHYVFNSVAIYSPG